MNSASKDAVTHLCCSHSEIRECCSMQNSHTVIFYLSGIFVVFQVLFLNVALYLCIMPTLKYYFCFHLYFLTLLHMPLGFSFGEKQYLQAVNKVSPHSLFNQKLIGAVHYMLKQLKIRLGLQRNKTADVSEMEMCTSTNQIQGKVTVAKLKWLV